MKNETFKLTQEMIDSIKDTMRESGYCSSDEQILDIEDNTIKIWQSIQPVNAIYLSTGGFIDMVNKSLRIPTGVNPHKMTLTQDDDRNGNEIISLIIHSTIPY